MGAEGGRETFRRHGRKRMQEIRARGFATLVARHFAGDKESAINWLHAHASESEIARLVSEKQAQQIAVGATCVVEESPILIWPEDDLSCDDSGPSWQQRVSGSMGARSR